MNRLVLVVVCISLLGQVGRAQQVPPALMARDQDKLVAITLSRLAVEVRIVGHVAETRMTMTFSNSLPRPLAGELYFPLPEGATVSGYALDIDGAMVDGVIVEKDRGRQVFESIVREGIDPGLVEWTKGNNFKTRVFPIPANGTRTIRVDYVSDLVDDPKLGVPSYQLPLNFKDKLAEASVRIDVVKPGDGPRVQHGMDNLNFEGWQDGFRAQTTLRDATLDRPLVVAVPGIEKQPVHVEKGPDGEIYFAIIESAPPPVAVAAKPASPGKIVILWDASGSRGSADKTREFEALKRLLGAYKGVVTVELVLFRNEAAPARRFEIIDGDASTLLGELANVDYDGGTQMSAIARPADERCDFYLLFSDGISNFGSEDPGRFNAPVYAFSADATANHAFLRYAAMLHAGGAYYNLNRVAPAAAADEIAAGARFNYLTVQADAGKFAGVYPRLSQPVQGRFSVVGILTGEEGLVRVTVGPPAQQGKQGQGGKTFEYMIRKADAVDGGQSGLIRRFWANQKLAELMIFPDRNEEDIVATGKTHGLVTPFTSLIVLETLEQYLQHGIRPPDSLPKMRGQYDEQIAARQADRKRQDADKLERVLAMWNSRVEWWGREFKYAKDFKFAPATATTQPEAVAGSSGLFGGEAGVDGSVFERSDPASAMRPRASGDSPAPPPVTPAPAEMPAQAMRDALAPAASNGPAWGDSGERPADQSRPQPGVAIKAWDPKTPYIDALKAAAPDKLFSVYMAQRKAHANSPAFYFDCAHYLFGLKQRPLAMQVLSNIAELELENAALLRVLAYKLAEENELDLAIDTFEKVRKLRPEEPQSHRDLALALARRAEKNSALLAAKNMPAELAAQITQVIYDDYKRSLDLLSHVVMNKWDRFEEVEVIALMELNAIWPRAKSVGIKEPPLDGRLIKLLDCDIRIVMSWDADATDIDLHVIEPSGERAYYGHNRTTIGGLVSRDFTDGYGPEEYILRRAMNGSYKIETNYYGSRAATVQGPVTLTVEVITNFGRATEKRRTITLRLAEQKETIHVGEMEF